MGLDSIRLQAEEHPVIEDTPSTSPAEHCLRLMHLKAYEEAAGHAVSADVLDVGCNTGYGTLRFLEVARRVVGVDVSDRAIEVARASTRDGRPEFVVIDGITLPFPDDSFDLVVSFQVIEHIEDPVPYLREIRRVARPSATVLFTTPNAGTRLYPGMKPWNRFHVREYLAPDLEAELREVFPDARVRGMFGTPTLYETEIDRVDAARQRIRKAEAAAAGPPSVAGATGDAAPTPRARRRPLPVRVVRALIPGVRARSTSRRNRRSGGGPAEDRQGHVAGAPGSRRRCHSRRSASSRSTISTTPTTTSIERWTSWRSVGPDRTAQVQVSGRSAGSPPSGGSAR